MVLLTQAPPGTTADPEVYGYHAEPRSVIDAVLRGGVGGTPESAPDWASSVAIQCPSTPVAQSALHPEVNAYPIGQVNGRMIHVDLRDHVFSSPVVLACFYDSGSAASPVACLGQGTCTWTGARADHIELWVPAATLYEGSIVKASVGDVSFTFL